jgi:putative thioredoxin
MQDPFIYDIDDSTFVQGVVEESRKRPVIVDFWAPQCQPCLMLGPLLEKVVGEKKGAVALAKVNVNEAQMVAAQFRISVIPLVAVVHNARVIDQFQGLLSEAELREFVDQFAPGEAAQPAPPSDPREAEKRHREALEKDPSSEEAKVGLAEALVALDRLDEADEVLKTVAAEGELAARADRVGAQLYFARKKKELPDETALRASLNADPENPQLLLQWGTLLACSGEHGKSLEVLLSVAERDMTLASGPVRETMVKVFYLLGPSHPLSNDYRARLARILY